MLLDFRTIFTRLLQTLGILRCYVHQDRSRVSDPTKFLQEGMHPPLNIREGKELSHNHYYNYRQDEVGNEVGVGEAKDFDKKPRRQGRKGENQEPKVELEMGEVEGYFMRVVSGRAIYAFEGVPYAEPPVGEYRFRAPVPKKRWNGTLQAKSWPPMCPQVRTKLQVLQGQEDCLYLNVYTPQLPQGKGNKRSDLPILVFIHGGAFATGSANEYGPSYLLQQDIVLITINYRLGVFGFLSTGNPACSGNWGLKDQALAIDWAHKYGEKFGGDQNRLVLLGQSAGAVGVHLHLMSPSTKNKIFAAIALSGTAFMTWGLSKSTDSIHSARRLAALNMCPWNAYTPHAEERSVDCLRSRSTASIAFSAMYITLTEGKVFIPVIEPFSSSAFITKTPTEYYKEGEVAPVPFITTMTSRELEITLALRLAPIEIELPIFPALAPTLLFYQDRESNYSVPEITRRVFNHYGNGQKIRSGNGEIAQILSDRHFSLGLRTALRNHFKIAKTYSYFFSYTSDLGFADEFKLDPTEFGVPHGEDVLYLFNVSGWKPIRRRQNHFAIVQLMQNIFYNFAKSGEPLYTDAKFVDHKIWDEVTTDSPVKFLQIDEEVKMLSNPYFQNATDFWQSLGIADL